MPINGHSRKGSLLVGGEGIDIKKGESDLEYKGARGEKMGGDESPGGRSSKDQVTRSRQPSILLLSFSIRPPPSSLGSGAIHRDQG